MIVTAPNLVTFGRILLIPVLAVLLSWIDAQKPVEYNQLLSFWAAIIFITAGISDLVDGYLARRCGKVSLMGKFIDPMADKLIHMTALVLLIPIGRIPAWMVVVLLFREIFISGLRAMAAGEGLIIDAGASGKKKTAWLNVGIIGLILYYPWFPNTAFEVNVYTVGMICLWIGFVYSVVSAVSYTMGFLAR